MRVIVMLTIGSADLDQMLPLDAVQVSWAVLAESLSVQTARLTKSASTSFMAHTVFSWRRTSPN